MAEESRAQPAEEAGPALPIDQLTQELRNLAEALGERILSSATDKIGGLTERLTDYVGSGGTDLLGAITGSSKHPMAAGLKGVAKMAGGGLLKKITRGGKSGKSKKLKLTNIVEALDVGAPRRLVYNQWTQFEDFPSFMKKVEGLDQETDEKTRWKAQIFLSHRTWEATIIEQVPDRHIIWRSKGAKGYVDGAVTFHEVTPDMTRILLVLEYHPQGLFERTGNIWRAQGRRVRLEFKHFQRHVMTQTLLHPHDVEGWRGEIRDSQVVKDHETALKEEQEQQEQEQEPQDEEEPREEGIEEQEEELEEGEQDEEEPEEEEEEEPEEEPRARRPVRRRRDTETGGDRPPPRPARRRAGTRGA
ncbi:putative membrane protein [Streptosporangium album]|uniref:Putative membrane protein n=1 Tax=Streptosporangium album TaxID=47479 RepID=A0A7W7RQ42_9ACTN|nr:SRPBCC family protein [Streptosporangium album]MBB4936124.1 putative membrane protein [Streptosporangium album]